MPVFTQGGPNRFDFWLIDGQREFARIPAGTIPGIDVTAPICLQTGTPAFGYTHIRNKHLNWLMLNHPEGCVATILHRKLSQNGVFHQRDGKHIIAMRMSPSALIVLRWQDKQNFYSVTSMYAKNGPCSNSENLNTRYLGQDWAVNPYRNIG